MMIVFDNIEETEYPALTELNDDRQCSHDCTAVWRRISRSTQTDPSKGVPLKVAELEFTKERADAATGIPTESESE